MKAPLSFCVITAGEPGLEDLIASVRPHVAEVCICYAGTDFTVMHAPGGETRRVDQVSALADRFVWYADALDEDGAIVDFSAARNVSFSLATQPWVAWGDSDDVVVGAGHFDAVLGCASGHARPRLFAPYEYSHDRETGECDKLQTRERIVRNDGAFRWERPVHEVLVAEDGRSEDMLIQQPVRWVHRRTAPPEKGRNLRILERAWQRAGERAEEDAWLALQLGLELSANGRPQDAIPHLERYVRISGAEEETAFAMVRLSDAHLACDPGMRGDAALWWARRAHALRPGSFAPLFQLAKLHSLLGITRGDEAALRQSIADARAAAALPEEPLRAAPVNPRERRYVVHDLARVNAETLGDWQTALEAAGAILRHYPADGPAKLAARKYRAALALERAESGTRVPVEGGERRGLDVLFYCGDTAERWNPEIMRTIGLGGSETAVVEVSRRLAAAGHRVRVFCNCGRAGEYDGVEYANELSASGERVDALVAWRNADHLMPVRAAAKLLWVHDLRAHRADAFAFHLADRTVAVSRWHAEELLRAHAGDLPPEKIAVLRNGIDAERFRRADVPERFPHRVIYASSPDRGLLQLLRLWPRVRAAVPDAELRVFYGDALLRMTGKGRAVADAVDAAARNAPGVLMRGKTGQDALAREMLSAGAWVHPSWLPDGAPWRETSCMVAMEAQAAGLRAVVTPHGALPETVFEGAFVSAASGEPDESWESGFAHALVRALTRPAEGGEREALAASVHARFSWDGVAAEWDRLLRELVGGAR